MTKVEATRQEYCDWCKAVGIDSVEKLNKALEMGYGHGLIGMCEARQERKYAEVADQVMFNRDRKRLVMMAGPSSSGKTSSALRIAQQCRAQGVFPWVIELDNYFVDRDKTPLDENGDKDYECLGAMNMDLLNSNINDLLAGKEVIIPRFDFVKGCTVFDESRKIQLTQNRMLFMEGIHALNPALLPGVDQGRVFHVFISPLSAFTDGEESHGTATDKRLLRRILRDNRTRAITPEENILRWPSVRKGEEQNIFPYAENADTIFNSSILYDIPLLKYYVEPLLYGVTESSPAHGMARHLLDFIEPFSSLKPAEIAAVPPASIMREFIGGQILM